MTNNISTYSVRLLFQSTHIPKVEGSFYEDSIVLVQARDEEELREKVLNYYQPYSYDNSDKGVTTVSLVHILDIYELVDSLEGESDIDFKEVYSQFIISEDKELSKEKIIERYNKFYGF